MALVLADRVRETTTVVGTGTATLLGAVTGYQSFTAVGNANTTYYVIASQAADEWEVGIGTYTASGTTLSRNTVLSSSNAGALVNFTAGTKDIWVDYAAGKAVTTDTLSSPPVIGNTTPNAATFTTLTATGQTSLGGDTSNPAFRANALSGVTRWIETSGSVAGTPQFQSASTGAAAGMNFVARGAAGFNFSTNTSAGTVQAVIAHTASAVNFVQVTGAATGGSPVISAQGSDTNIPLTLNSKGNNGIIFQTRGAGTPRVALQLLDSGSASVNYLQIQSNISGAGPVLSALGTDTNISQVFQSKGTGAIDLAAGSSGVNISNGGTVTAITRTSAGSGYTSIPSVAISAPTTAGGVQSTVTTPISINAASISNGGTGYTLNDVITVVGGTFATTASRFTVSAVSGGVVTGLTASVADNYTVFPTQPASTTGGTGTGLTLTSLSGFVPSGFFVITNAGSGYVEQPTVTFSGGGGSGAAAYATVGSATVIKTLGSTSANTGFSFQTPAGEQVRISDNGSTTVNYIAMWGGGAGTAPRFVARGADADVSLLYSVKGAGNHVFRTNDTNQTQFQVAHTASAVNFVQVTGAATGGLPTISAQGSDTNVAMFVTSKGNGTIRFATNNAAQTQLRISHTTSAVNFLNVTGSIAGAAPVVSVDGNDTNIDLTLTPKGTGNVRFGTYTANMALTIQGYVEIKDSGGTIRRLAVIA